MNKGAPSAAPVSARELTLWHRSIALPDISVAAVGEKVQTYVRIERK